MNKRAAQFQGGEERYGPFGGQQQEEMAEQPRQATAAQLAKRKIAPIKRRPRSESPMTSTGSIYEQANQLSNGQPPANPFNNTNSSFTFGSSNTNGAATPSFGSGSGSFNFGGNNAPTQNGGNTGFTFGSSSTTTPAGSFAFGQNATQPSQTPQSTGFSFGQQNGTNTFNFSQNDATPKPAGSTPFAGFGTAHETPKQNPFGAPAEPAKPSTPFGSTQDSQKSQSTLFGSSTIPATTNGFKFGADAASSETPKATNMFSAFGQSKEAQTPKTDTTNGWASFTQQKPSQPATNGASLFNTAPQTNGASSIFSGLNAQTTKVPTFKFTPLPDNSTDNDLSMMSPENTPQKPTSATTNGFNADAVKSVAKPLFDAGKGPSLFDRISKPEAPQTPSQSTQAPSAPLFQSSSLFTPKPAITAQPAQPKPAPAVSSTPARSTATSYTGLRELNESLLQHLSTQDQGQDWSKIFQYYTSEVGKLSTQQSTTSAPISQTPKPAFSFGNNAPKPATPAPTGLFGQSTQAKAPEQPSYPSLPATASNTAKLFQATLEKSKPAPSLFAAKPSEPSTGGFKPTGGASAASSFLSSFGQQATETAKKEQEKRKDEDYDSDDGDEAEWEKKDREEQEKKKAALEAAGKTAGGFVFKPATATSTSSVFSGLSQPKTAETTPFSFSNSTAATPKLGLFGAPSTPATTSNGPSIFASAASTTPAPLFSFAPSTTPAAPANTAETEGEEGDAAPPEPQLEDMAVLLPSEAKENDVLLHVEKAKTKKLESRPAEGGTEKLTWIDKGLGPLWILRGKQTGKVRILQKIKDSGRAAMNFSVLSGANLYKHEGMGGKAVLATFVDHLNPSGGKPSRWMIVVGQPNDAKEIVTKLQEGQQNA